MMRSISGCNHRKGVATIEVAFVLPFVAIILIVMFTVAGIIFTLLDTEGLARYQAWSGRHRPWLPSELYETVEGNLQLPERFDRILGDTQKISPTEVIHAEVEAEALMCTRNPMFDPFRIVLAEHYTMGGSWDFCEIEFEDEGRHPRLQPTEKFQYFIDRYVDFSPFESLENFASASSIADLRNAQLEHRREDREHRQEAERSKKEVREAIQLKEAEKSALESRLADLLDDDPVDAEQVEKVRNELNQVLSQLDKLHKALDHINSAESVHPKDTYMAPSPTLAK